MFTRLVLATALSVALCSPIFAQSAGPKPVLQYLTAADLNPALFVPAPPADGSALQKAGLAEIIAIQNAATPERKEKAIWDDRNENIGIWEHYLGGTFNLKALPLTAALLKEVHDEGDIAADMAKVHFNRLRPWNFDEAMYVCEDKPRQGAKARAYPSGHGTLGFSTGVVLANLLPSRAAEILTIANDYGFSRVVCGTHYTSDLIASQIIGTTTAELLLHNAAFKPKFEAAKLELEKAGFAAN